MKRRFAFEQVPVPANTAYRGLAPLMQRDGPIDIEIGCGAGWHSVRYAMSHLERSLIAIERTSTKFAAFESRMKHHAPLPNLFGVHADAISWITHAPSELRFERVFLFYPNPEPRNSAQRWIRMPFFGHLLERTSERGSVQICTNVESYANEIVDRAPDWKLVLAQSRVLHRSTDPAFAPRTHFEKKYFEREQKLFELRLVKHSG
jgi:tRNA G46 methylase TrmB